MEITRISKMGQEDKFAVFVDGILKLVVSGKTVLENGLSVGKKVSSDELSKLEAKSTEDKLNHMALRYISLRLRSEGEVRTYLKRKGADQPTIAALVAKYKELGLIDDEYYAKAFIHDKMLHSAKSRRKLSYELSKRQIAEEMIETSLNEERFNDQESLKKLIVQKRQNPKYKDDLKLMQYLVRAGFSYGDVKDAIRNTAEF